MTAKTNRTPGERLVHQYFREHGIPVADHPEIDGAQKRPDIVLGEGLRRVVCEVADFDIGEPDKPILAALDANRRQHPSGISFSTAVGALPVPEILDRIRGKIVRELVQIGEFRGRCPLIVMLYNEKSLSTDLDDQMIATALCGLVTPELNTHLSALALVRTTRAGSNVERRVLRGRRKDNGGHRPSVSARPSTEELVGAFEALEREKRDWGGELDVEHPALRVYHNCFAVRPVAVSVFPPPFVSHARLVPEEHDDRDPQTGAVIRAIHFGFHEIPLPPPRSDQ